MSVYLHTPLIVNRVVFWFILVYVYTQASAASYTILAVEIDVLYHDPSDYFTHCV